MFLVSKQILGDFSIKYFFKFLCSNGDDDVASIKCNYSWKYIFLGFLSIKQFSFVQVN